MKYRRIGIIGAVDLVFEAAHADELAAIAPRVRASSDLCGFRYSALSRPDVECTVTESCQANGTQFFVPHGAILGLDRIVDGRDCIEEVNITTTKIHGLPIGGGSCVLTLKDSNQSGTNR
jgi:predicted dinucleotide-utilizing enzyme